MRREQHWVAFWSHAWMLGWVLFFSVFVSLLSLTLPMFMLLTYDRVLNARSMETLTALVLIAFVCLATMGVLDYVRRRTMALFGAALQTDLEKDLLEVNQVDRLRGENVENVMGELNTVRSFIHSGQAIRILDVIWVPLFIGVVFILNPTLGWVAAGGLVCVTGVFALGQVLSAPSRALAQQASDALSGLSTALGKTRNRLAGMHAAPAYLKRWLKLRDASRDAAVAARDRSAAFEALLSTLQSASSVTILAVGAALVLQDLLTVGAMIAAVIMVNRILFPAIQCLRAWPAFRNARKNWHELGNRLARDATAPASHMRDIENAPVLRARRLCLSTAAGQTAVLNGLDLEIPSGHVVIVDGPSGSGKTLLCDVLAMVRPPESGSLQYCGIHRDALPEDRRARLVGYVPEDHIFFPGSLVLNISRLDEDVATPEVRQAAKDAGLLPRIASLRDGFDTVITEDGQPLARGAKEALSLARAFYTRPRLLIVDTPSRALLRALEGDATLRSYLSNGGSILVTAEDQPNVADDFPVSRLHLEDGKLWPCQPATPHATVHRLGA